MTSYEIASETLTRVAAELRSDLRGEVILPGDDAYDAARRVWNGAIDRRPALIARAADAQDVARVIRAARANGIELAVRGGGHGMPGYSTNDGGIVLDLALMKGTRVDVERRRIRAEAGLNLGELIRATRPFGLATTTGTVSDTGIAGLTLGGGMGWLMSKYGLTVDNLLAVELVTADGDVLTATADANPDLFWAVRGGGGNFGVVTAFTYQLHPVSTVLGGMVVHPMARARDVLRFYRDFTRDNPDELTAYAALITAPDGHPVVAIAVCYHGDLAEGERVLAPVRQFGPPLADLIGPMDYHDLICMLDAGAPRGRSYYSKANTLPALGDGVIEAIAAAGERLTSPGAQILVQHMHGAATRVAPDATAFSLRQECYVVDGIAAWDAGDTGVASDPDPHVAWARELWGATEPYATSGIYVNFLGDEGAGRVRASYGANYDRLVAIKNRYDPTNLFHLNQNIPPTL